MAFSCVTGRSRIELASLSGAARKELVSRSIRWPTGLALDWPAGRLYWADARTFTVECILLDGTDRKIVRKMGSGNVYTLNYVCLFFDVGCVLQKKYSNMGKLEIGYRR